MQHPIFTTSSAPIDSLSQISTFRRNTHQRRQGAQCQKCLEYGHLLYECKNPRKYTHRPSRTALLGKVQANKEAIKGGGEVVKSGKGIVDEILRKRKKERRERDGGGASTSSSSDTDSSSDSDSDS
ncbi:hypothetical protein HK104_001081, partial [Borealophlyctis nickersoniae]